MAEITRSLPPKKQLYVEARLEGKSRRASALTAGYSESMANHPYKIETKDVRDAFAALMREAVPPERIAKTIAEGMGATETKFFSHEGVDTAVGRHLSRSRRRRCALLVYRFDL